MFCLLIGHFIGRKRHIGFWGSTFLCLGMSIMFGIILTFISPKLNLPPHRPTRGKLIAGIVLIILGFPRFYISVNKFTNREIMNREEIGLFQASTFILTLGIYLYTLSKSKSNPPNLLR